MTAQEIFSTVVKHLYMQKQRSLSQGWCAYRSEKGLKCAIGCLIPDSEYYQDMEYESLSGIIKVRKVSTLQTMPIPFLLKLQQAHDDPRNWDEDGPSPAMHAVLSKLAEDYNLDMPS